MTEKELRKEIGIGDKDLIDSPNGLVDILDVCNDTVVLGYLRGRVRYVSVNKFLQGWSSQHPTQFSIRRT